MNILYIIGEGCSHCDNNELRYSLRSIEKYGIGVDKIFVAGYCPWWLSEEVVKIPCEDIYDDKNSHNTRTNNVLHKLLVAVDTHPELGDEFLVSFDDNFYIRETDFNNYPHYVKISDIDNSITLSYSDENSSDYRKMLSNTRTICDSFGLPYFNFAVHRNLYVTKKAIDDNREFLNKCVNEAIPCDRFVFLNNYSYKNDEFEIKPVKDVKLGSGREWWKVNPIDTECFSTADFDSDSGLNILLHSLFPDRSKYEQASSYSKSVSIIIPVYNTPEASLKRCLDSVINQTLKDIEIICVNDGSTDNSLDILYEYSVKDNRIKIINTKNHGVSNARNVGISVACGEYISFADSDDYIDTGFCEELYSHHMGYDIIWGIRVIGEENKHSKTRPYGSKVAPSMFRKKFLDDNTLRFSERLKKGEDTAFVKKYMSYNPVIYKCEDKGIYYHYIKRTGSLSDYKI